ncbi:hypothetical protein RJ640_011400, partial [Escallonia rubra]
SLVANEEFQHILRILNTNVDGKQKIMFAVTSIKGIGRRYSNIVCKKADVNMNKRYYRAGEMSAEEIEKLMTIVANPREFNIPDWFLNRQKDYKDGKYSQVVSNALDMKLRDDLERLKKIRWFTNALLQPHPSLFSMHVYEHQIPQKHCTIIGAGTTVVSDTTGVSECVGNTPRQLDAEARLLVSPRSVKNMVM